MQQAATIIRSRDEDDNNAPTGSGVTTQMGSALFRGFPPDDSRIV